MGDNVCDQLHSMLADDELRDAALLVFANKQDLPNAMGVSEITERLKLNKLRNRDWYIQSSCAKTGDGLYEGLDWLSNTLKERNNNICSAAIAMSICVIFVSYVLYFVSYLAHC